MIFESFNITEIDITEKNIGQTCKDYELNGRLNRYFIPSIWKNHLAVNSDDITFVMQLSASSFHLINQHARQWSGPLSITIYINATKLLFVKAMFIHHNLKLKRTNIYIHFILAQGVSKTNYFLENIKHFMYKII